MSPSDKAAFIKRVINSRNKMIKSLCSQENRIIRFYFDGELPDFSYEDRETFFKLIPSKKWESNDESITIFVEICNYGGLKHYNHDLSPKDNAYILYHNQGENESESEFYERMANNQYVYNKLGPIDLSNEWISALNYKGRATQDDFNTVAQYYNEGRLDELNPNGLFSGNGLFYFEEEDDNKQQDDGEQDDNEEDDNKQQDDVEQDDNEEDDNEEDDNKHQDDNEEDDNKQQDDVEQYDVEQDDNDEADEFNEEDNDEDDVEQDDNEEDDVDDEEETDEDNVDDEEETDEDNDSLELHKAVWEYEEERNIETARDDYIDYKTDEMHVLALDALKKIKQLFELLDKERHKM
jgi:hypothetical protein